MKRSVWSKILSLLLVLAMTAVWLPMASPMTALAAEITARCTCGWCTVRGTVTGSLNTATGVLTFSGAGMICDGWDMDAHDAPWASQEYADVVTKIIINEGVTSIGFKSSYGSVFGYYTKLTSVSIPSSVTYIQGSAFYGCTSLTSISIPDKVEGIGYGAFSDCTKLTSVNLTENSKLTDISGYAFYGCTALATITLPKSVTKIGDGAFQGCIKLSSVYFRGNAPAVSSATSSWTDGDGEKHSGASFEKDIVTLYYESGKTGWTTPTWQGYKTSVGSATNAATPVIFAQPEDITVNVGEPATLRVSISATSGMNLSYQWYSKATSNSASGTLITAATNSTYSPPTSGATVWYYYCVITNTDNTATGNKTAQVTSRAAQVTVLNIPIVNVAFEDTTIGIPWRLEAYFKDSATVYNHELATAGLSLVNALYKDITRNKETSSLYRNTFEKLGFKNAKKYPDEKDFSMTNPHHVIAHSKVTINGKTTHIFGVVIRGTEYDEWWRSTLGTADNVIGDIKGCADSVRNSIISYIKTLSTENGIKNGDDIKFFITGHSRGGAIADLLGYKLTEECNSGNVLGYPTDKKGGDSVFVYAYASLYTDALKNYSYQNIINICNTEDIAPSYPFSRYRYGRVVEVKRNTDFYDKYKELTGKSYTTFGGYLIDLAYPVIGIGDHYLAAHSHVTYMALVLTKQLSSTRTPVKIYSFKCPVDVDVYTASGVLIGRIVNNKVDASINVGIGIWVNGDEKNFILPFDEDYIFKMIGTDNGVMTYSVSNVNPDTWETLVQKDFENVPLFNGKTMTSNTGNSVDAKDVRLFVTDASGKVVEEIIGRVISLFPFADVKTSDWFYNDVKTAYESGLVNGTSATAFSPNNNLTYAEAVKLAACMYQKHTTGSVTLTNGNPWYQSYVDYAKANKIISKDYNWNAPATRAGYMEIFANALPDSALPAINTMENGAIPDVPMTHPNASAIYKLYRAGIIQGVNAAHNCNPSSNIKRSEVAAILTRMMDSTARVRFQLVLTQSDTPASNSVGNTSGNIINGGRVAIQGERIYYSSIDFGSRNGKLNVMNLDGNGKQQLIDEPACYINVVGDRIYYGNFNISGIFTIKTDGSDKKKLCNDWVSEIIVVDGRIYYQTPDQGNIFSMKIDGSDKRKLNDDNSSSINVIGDRIYYLDDRGKMYSMRTDGSDRKSLLSGRQSLIIVVDGQVYYRDWENDKLYVENISGGGKRKICDDISFSFNVAGEWIYYHNNSDGDKLYKIRTDGSGRQKLTDGASGGITIIGDRIYYREDRGKMYSMNTDGSDRISVD